MNAVILMPVKTGLAIEIDVDSAQWAFETAPDRGADRSRVLFRDAVAIVLPGMFGTLAANLIGGYVIGLAIAYFAQATDLAPEWRLFVITGFCGGLTTFSTFSAEVVTLLEGDRLAAAVGAITMHVTGSLAMTVAGLASWRWMQVR